MLKSKASTGNVQFYHNFQRERISTYQIGKKIQINYKKLFNLKTKIIIIGKYF